MGKKKSVGATLVFEEYGKECYNIHGVRAVKSA